MDYFSQLPATIQISIWSFLSPPTFLSLATNINHSNHSLITKQTDADILYQRLFATNLIDTIHSYKQSSHQSWRTIFYLIKSHSSNRSLLPLELQSYYWSLANHQIDEGTMNDELREWIEYRSPREYFYSELIELVWDFLHPPNLPPALHRQLIDQRGRYQVPRYKCSYCYANMSDISIYKYNATGYVVNYCSGCHHGALPYNLQSNPSNQQIELIWLQSFITKQILYKLLKPVNIVNIFPHDSATCALCYFTSSDHFRSWLTNEEIWNCIVEEANNSLNESQYFPLDDNEQDAPLVPNDWYTFDRIDSSIVRFAVEGATTMTEDQRAHFDSLDFYLTQECEVQYIPHRELDHPRFVQVLAWKVEITHSDQSRSWPSEFGLSRDCHYWDWKAGVIDRIKPRLPTIQYRERE